MTRRFVVDRREGKVLVLEDEAGAMHDVPAADLPEACRREGSVVDVPVEGGKPDWAKARRNPDEERRRLKALADRMNQMRKRDPGGDVEV